MAGRWTRTLHAIHPAIGPPGPSGVTGSHRRERLLCRRSLGRSSFHGCASGIDRRTSSVSRGIGRHASGIRRRASSFSRGIRRHASGIRRRINSLGGLVDRLFHDRRSLFLLATACPENERHANGAPDLCIHRQLPRIELN